MDMSRSFSAPSEETMRQELQALSRKDLQALAKQEGVKANISSASIIEELLRLANIAADPKHAVKEVLPVMRAQGPAMHTDAPASSSHPIPSARRAAAPAQPAILGKQVAAASRPSTSSAGSGGGGSRPDIAGTEDKDQATTASQQTGTAKPRPLPEAARASADVTSTSVSSGRSGNRRKRWEVPAAAAAFEPHEQQVHRQMQQLSLGVDVQVDPVQQHRAAVHQQPGLQQQQPTSRPVVASTSSSMPSARHGDVQQDQLPPQASRVQAAVQRLQQQPQSQQFQQQSAASAQAPAGNMLHTPMRVRVKDPATAATNGTAAAAAAAAAAAVGSRPMQDVSRPAAPAAAVTPTKQKVQAFGGEVAAAPAPTAAPVRPPAATAAGPAATAAAAAVPAGLMSPRLAVMGSARRVVPTQSKLAPSAAAAAAGSPPATASAAPATAAGSAAAVGSRPATAAASGPSLTPLQKGARRAVPADAEQQVLDEDRKLEMLVERCLRIANPDAPQTVLQGPEPAKRWLHQHLITPLRRAYPAADQLSEGAAAARSSSSSSSKSCCLAAGYCHKALLLYGPSGSGKTELVHALASGMGANLLYVPAGDLLKSHQEKGHRLLRALFKVSKRVSPTVICFDDAHRSFPADARMSNPNHPSHKLLVELTVQLQQLADMQAQLQDKLQRPNSGNSSSSTAQPVQQSKVKKPAWGMFGGSKQQKQQDDNDQQQQHKPQAPTYQQLPGPIVVIFATRHPEALEPALLPLLPDRLLLDLPSVETREDILMAWLMAKEAAIGVPDVELLAKRTEGFSCTDLLQLCHEAAMRPVQERSHRAVSIRDFEAAFQKVTPSISPQRRMQLKAWSSQ